MAKVFEIGRFRLDPGSGVLMHAGRPTALGPRAVAVLAALVGRANEYVAKAELLEDSGKRAAHGSERGIVSRVQKLLERDLVEYACLGCGVVVTSGQHFAQRQRLIG